MMQITFKRWRQAKAKDEHKFRHSRKRQWAKSRAAHVHDWPIWTMSAMKTSFRRTQIQFFLEQDVAHGNLVLPKQVEVFLALSYTFIMQSFYKSKLLCCSRMHSQLKSGTCFCKNENSPDRIQLLQHSSVSWTTIGLALASGVVIVPPLTKLNQSLSWLVGVETTTLQNAWPHN